MKRFLLIAILSAMALSSMALAKDSTTDRAQAMIDKAIDYLKKQQQPGGGWQTGAQPPAITAVVLKAIVQDEKYDANTDFEKRGYDKLLTFQMEDGGIYKD